MTQLGYVNNIKYLFIPFEVLIIYDLVIVKFNGMKLLIFINYYLCVYSTVPMHSKKLNTQLKIEVIL